jgi:hypothetical protein
VISRRIGVAAAVAATLLAVPATASGAVTHRNSCQYSYDGYWRDMDVTVGGTAGVAAAQPGDPITVGGHGMSVALPDWLAQYGYNFGLLRAGHNEIPVRVWLALRGVNTVEGTRLQAFETVAETDIETANGAFVSATPIEYSVPVLPATQWTARGGPVEFRQAGSGSLPDLPVGPGGRDQKPKGSLFISAALGEATLGLDCVPGEYIAQGSERVETTPAPFATVDVPSFQCISALTASVRLEPVPERGLPSARSETEYSYAPAVSYLLPGEDLASEPGDNAVTIALTAAVSGRVLTGSASAVVRGEEPSDVAGVARLSPWRGLPSTGPLGFTVSGTLGAVTVEGVAQPVRPYGSLYARVSIASAGGSVKRFSLDCVSGVVGIASPSTPYSVLGDQEGGDRGRYAIAPYPLDPFATAYVEPSVTPKPTPTATATPVAVPVATPAATAAPSPTPAPAGRPSVASKRLRVSGKRVAVAISCAGATACTGKLALRTAGKVKLGKKRRVVTMTRSSRYAVAAGRRVTVRLTLSADGHALLRRVRRVSVRATGAPSSRLTLTR